MSKLSEKESKMTVPDIENSETLFRLLCSPQFYNETLDIVNPDAFDLRMLPKNKPEDYVSLGRKIYLDTEEEFNKYIQLGHRIKWPAFNPPNQYTAYGAFNCGEAREVHQMVEIKALEKGPAWHVGLYYTKPNGEHYAGPLPKTDPEILDVLSSLADLLTVTRIKV